MEGDWFGAPAQDAGQLPASSPQAPAVKPDDLLSDASGVEDGGTGGASDTPAAAGGFAQRLMDAIRPAAARPPAPPPERRKRGIPIISVDDSSRDGGGGASGGGAASEQSPLLRRPLLSADDDESVSTVAGIAPGACPRRAAALKPRFSARGDGYLADFPRIAGYRA